MIKGDRIKLVKPMGVFTNVGEICEVTDVAEGGVISFRFGGHHLGCMSYDEYEKYFEKVEIQVKQPWTEWIKSKIGYRNFDDEDVMRYVEYRHNGTKVQVRCGHIKARSSCCNEDVFDLGKGLELAHRRLIIKLLASETAIYASTM